MTYDTLNVGDILKKQRINSIFIVDEKFDDDTDPYLTAFQVCVSNDRFILSHPILFKKGDARYIEDGTSATRDDLHVIIGLLFIRKITDYRNV